MKRRCLSIWQRIFRSRAAKSSGRCWISSSAESEIVRVVGKDIGGVRAHAVDRNDDILRDIDRVRGENGGWTVKRYVSKKIDRAITATRVKFDQSVGIEQVARADVEGAIRPERADFYNVAVECGGVDVYSSGKSGRFNVHRALIGLNLSADENLAVAGGGQHCNLTWIPGSIEQGEKLRAAIDVNAAQRLDLDLVRVHRLTNLDIIAGLGFESAVVRNGTFHRHGCGYLDVVYGLEFNSIEVGHWRCQRDISSRAVSENEESAEIREADAR